MERTPQLPRLRGVAAPRTHVLDPALRLDLAPDERRERVGGRRVDALSRADGGQEWRALHALRGRAEVLRDLAAWHAGRQQLAGAAVAAVRRHHGRDQVADACEA